MAIAETGLQGGFEVSRRRWQNAVDSTRAPLENFKKHYPQHLSLFNRYFGEHSTSPDNHIILNQLLDSGRIDFDFLECALLEGLIQGGSPKKMRTFLVNFDWLAQSISAKRLKDLFMSLPSIFWNCLLQLGDDENTKTALQKYFSTSRVIDLQRLLDDVKMKLLFDIYEVASLNASSGVLRNLGLRLDQVMIKASFEIDLALLRRKFSGYEIGVNQIYGRDPVISFHDDNHFYFGPRSVSLSYQPFKFGVPGRVSNAVRESLRRRLGVAGERKIIVVSSPDEDELPQILSAYRKLKADTTMEPPLLILGLRYPNNKLAISLQDEGLKAQIRDERDQKNKETWTAAGESIADLDIVILHTTGELMDLFAISDVAIVGQNRNLMEPAAQGVPILYADGSWSCNQMAKALLDQSGAAHVFDPKILDEQIRERLNHPEHYRDQAKPAFTVLNEQLIPNATTIAALAIGIQILRDAPPKTESATFSHAKFW